MAKQKKRGRKNARTMALFLAAAMTAQNSVPALAAAVPQRVGGGSIQNLAVLASASNALASSSNAEKEEAKQKASASSAQKLLSEETEEKNVLPNGSFEETVSGNTGGVWLNNTMPEGWHDKRMSK